MAPMHVLSIGGSRHSGYWSAVRLLEQGSTVSFLLRRPSVFDEDPVIQKFVRSGAARLIKGDAKKEEDMAHAWEQAGIVDAVIFSVGGAPEWSLTKGLIIDPNLVAGCMLCVLRSMPIYDNAQPPKFVAISTTGLGPVAHKALPTLIKPLYSALATPHYDKIGMEQVLAYCAGRPLDPSHGEPRVEVLGENWTQRLPPPGTLKHRVLVVRPALLTNGKCMADELEVKGKGKGKAPYRASAEELHAYTISRKDVAHFVVNALGRWDEFEGKYAVNVGY
ncbi:hypothetical protein C8F04DRAFT_1012247 [Mycena alexandri]|uniref:NAD(P)-binding domain-containing protein n=1 Tax=Mycena alexandri TaxID=1745969 RepID=A0AAD6WRT6_9AGAR|nr:hypothetical protein C8F04DRAFT_1012247 [Mycena alexandri]